METELQAQPADYASDSSSSTTAGVRAQLEQALKDYEQEEQK